MLFRSYTIASIDWGSLVSFKLTKDIYLIDYFDLDNLKKIYELAESIHANKFIGYNKAKFLEVLKVSTGFNTTLNNQLLYLDKNYKWDEYWVYTDNFNKGFEYNYCNSPKINGINPIGAVVNIHSNDLVMFDLVLSKFPKIDGIIRRTVSSNLDINGKFYHEEILLKNSSLL